MAKFPLYQWKKAAGGSSSIDTSNFASKIKANTFTNKNIFENTGSVVSIKTTDDQSFGIEFKDNSNDMVGFVGTNTNDNEQKIILSGELGLQLRTPNKDINVNSGTGQFLYNGTSTAKNRREVLCRNDFYYVKKITQNAFNVPANGVQTAEYTVNGLTTGLNEFYVVLTVANIDIGFDIKIQCNNLSYKNMGEVKTFTTTDLTSQTDLTQSGLIHIGFVISNTNKFRFRMKSTHNAQINFTGMRVYHRIPGKIVDN